MTTIKGFRETRWGTARFIINGYEEYDWPHAWVHLIKLGYGASTVYRALRSALPVHEGIDNAVTVELP